MSAQTEQTINSEATAAPPPNPRIQSWKNFYKKLAKNKAAMVGLSLIIFFIVVALIGPYFTTHDPYEPNVMNKLAEPSAEHWFGTDHHGRDIFTRIIHGMSITLYVGFFSVVLGAIVGVILGVVSGYYGRLVDTVIMRIMDVLLAFPGILLALAIISILGGSINNVI
ncbi:ABC transporter permease, partial [Halalkalibacterium halodurans]|nr:ABC transporter permease [Halalkalibacterium halodurans]